MIECKLLTLTALLNIRVIHSMESLRNVRWVVEYSERWSLALELGLTATSAFTQVISVFRPLILIEDTKRISATSMAELINDGAAIDFVKSLN